MTEPTKEQIDKWRIEAQVFIENEKQIHSPLDLYMVTLAYLAAKKSDFEEIKTLIEQLTEAVELLRYVQQPKNTEEWLDCGKEIDSFLEKQDKDKQGE